MHTQLIRRASAAVWLFLVGVSPLLFFSASGSAQDAKDAQSLYKLEVDEKVGVRQVKVEMGTDGKYKEVQEGGQNKLLITVRFVAKRQSNAVGDLKGDYSVRILEDNKIAKIVKLPSPQESTGLSTVLAMDISGSMREGGRMKEARDAATFFINSLPAKAEAGLILFDHEIRPEDEVQLSENRREVLGRIEKAEPRGGTAYLDACMNGIKMLKDTDSRRKRVLVVMTDGVDIASEATLDDVIRAAIENNVSIFPIGIGNPGAQDLKVTSVLALDKSGSMLAPANKTEKFSKLESLQLAANAFVKMVRDSKNDAVRTSIIEFSDSIRMPHYGFTRDKKRLRQQVKEIEGQGETCILDATYAALCMLEAENPPGKKAVIALTDGIDNTSRRRKEEVIDRARKAGIPIFMLGFGSEDELDGKMMDAIAKAAGGKYYHVNDQKKLLETFEDLAIKLHDDGIDEVTLKLLAFETKGRYYHAKNVSDLKLIAGEVNALVNLPPFEIEFPSLRQTSDGTSRGISLQLMRGSEVLQTKDQSVAVRGSVVAQMSHLTYLGLLAGLGALVVLPGGLSKLLAKK